MSAWWWWKRRMTRTRTLRCPHHHHYHHLLLLQHRCLYRTIAGYYCTSRNSSASRSDVIEKAQSYDDVSWSRDTTRRNRGSWSWDVAHDEAKGRLQPSQGFDDDDNEKSQRTRRTSGTGDEQTMDQNQLNAIGENLSDSSSNCDIHYYSGWQSYQQQRTQPEQDKLLNIQCQRKPLAYKSGPRSREWRRVNSFLFRDKSIGQLTLCLLHRFFAITLFFLCPSSPHHQQNPHHQQRCNFNLAETETYFPSTVTPAGTPIEFTLAESSARERMIRKFHLDTNRCWLPYFWSTVIVILLQNVFIAANLLPLLVPLALGLCANYQHCSSARIVDTCTKVRRESNMSKCAIIKVVEEVQGNDLEQYHQQEVPEAGEKRQIQEENQMVFWTLRQFHISRPSPDNEEELRIFPMNEFVFKILSWQRRRKCRVRKTGTEEVEEAGQVEVIVAKKKRKLLDFPAAFYKPSSSSSERPVNRISGLFVDKQSFYGSHRANRKSISCNITINGMCCGFNSLPRHPSVKVEDVVVGVESNVDRITGKSANSSSRLVAQWSFSQQRHYRQQNQSCTSNTTRTCDGGGIRPTQSIGTFHQPQSGRTVAIDFSAYQELNDIECGYSNYCNHKAAIWTVKRSLCVLALQRETINRNNTRNQLSLPVFDEDEQLISKELSTDTWILHLVVKLIAIALIIQPRRRKSESCDLAMPEMSLTITVRETSTIRVIIHGQKRHHPQQQHQSLGHQMGEKEEAAMVEKLSVYSQDVIVVVVAGDTCGGNAFELHWCLRLSCASSAISTFPFQTGTCSSVDLKCPTSLTMMMMAVTSMAVRNSPLLSRGTEKKAFKEGEEGEKLKETSNSQTEWATNRQRGEEAREEWTRPSPKTNVAMSMADGMEIKLKHYNSSKDIKGRVCETGWILPCPRATSTDKRRHLVLLLTVAIIFVVNLPSVSCLAAPGPQGPSPGVGGIGSFKYSTNVVKTKYGPLRGIVLRSHPVVEAYLGVPYATPPVGSLRYMPPMTPSSWKATRLADRYAPVCPQRVPMPDDGDAALLDVPRERLAQLRRFRPLLTNQSEDCLYLNLYVPRSDPPRDASASGNDRNHDENPLKAAIVYVHGESFEWNSGNLYDGTMLAAHGDVIVVTINFRLGILGFLKTGTKDSAQGNFGLMDLVAGLHWLRENLPAFNGDGNKITVMGHGTGAALANILVVSPVASDLITRVILLSGSALSPWAIQKEPLIIKRRVAEQTGCHGDLLVDDIAPCLRNKSVKELLAVNVDSPRFLPGFAPFIDGTVIVNPVNIGPIPLTLPIGSAIVSTNGIEFANYPTKEILFGLTALESYLDLNAQDLEFGFNETRRDRILRTFVRNVFHFHLNEIYSMLKNEYTDWERPARSPIASRDATMELLSDGHTAAPLIRMAYLHSVRGGRSYFLHFRHQTNERDFPQRVGSVRGEDVPFCLGLPLSPLFPYNYTKQDYKISIILVRYLSNFAKSGNPNGHSFASGSLSSLSASTADDVAMTGVASSAALTDISKQQPPLTKQQQQRRSVGVTAGDGTSGKKYLINNEGGSGFNINSARLKFKARRRRKRQPLGVVGDNNRGGGGAPDAGMSQTKFSQLGGAGSGSGGRSSSNNNNKHRDIYSSADNDKEAFLRNYELNINSAALRRMKGSKGPKQTKEQQRQRQIEGGGRGNSNSAPPAVEADEDDELDAMMLNDDDNAGVLNAIAAVRNGGDLVDKNRGDDKWIDEPDDEYYPVRDHFSDLQNLHMPFWDSYDSINQLYLEIGTKTEIKNHYRGHKLSMWLNLIPQLHASGDPELPMRHHHFAEESAQFYDGNVRSQSMTRPPNQEITIIQPPTTMMPQNARPQKTAPVPNLQTTDCPINLTVMMPSAVPDHHNQQVPVIDGQQQQSGGGGGAATALDAAANKKATNVLYYSHNNGTGTGLQPPPGIPPQSTINANNDNASTFNLLRRLANSQFQNYNTALTVTVVVGCFLLLLNVLIFVGIYYQREKRVKEARRKDELVELDCQQQQQQLASCSGGGGSSRAGLISSRSPIQGSEKNDHKSSDGMTMQGHKGSFQSVRNFGNFNEYRCYDEKNFQQHHHPQQQNQHFGSRHNLHNHHHSHGSLNRKYLVDVCHNVPNGNGSVADLHHLDTVMYAGDYSPSAALAGTTMSREHSVSSSHIAHNGGVGSNLSLHQSQQQLHHHHHHTCQSRRHSLVTEGTQSDPISLKDLEYETGGASSGNQQQQNAAKKKGVLLVGGSSQKKGCDLSDCRGMGDTVTGGTQTDGADSNIENDEDPDGEEEDEEEEGEEEEEEDDESPDIPEPPPPPRGILTGGILRTHTSNAANISSVGRDSPPTATSSFGGGSAGNGLTNANSGSTSHAGNSSSTTASATKKRVQIQEISV